MKASTDLVVCDRQGWLEPNRRPHPRLPADKRKGDGKMKMIWKVSQESRQTYDVVAKTLESAQQKLSARTEWGEFRPMPISAHLNGDKSVTVTVGYTILMPVWKGYKDAPTQCREEWDRMWMQLDKHEQLHRGLYYAGATKLYDDLASRPAGSLTQTQITDLARAMGVEIDLNSRNFDSRTLHGQKEGVSLDPPYGCRAMDF
jgi:hypothetical protein